ncbi:MAG: hypothetical protein H6737_04435 [Alphaproteobacteria bacterium]|nr:hypothetical protein [Alphaproteobacteria bacterium]
MLLWLSVALAGSDGNAWSVTASDDLEIRYWIRDQRLPDPSDVPVFNYVEGVNRLNLAASRGAWKLNTQLDQVALLANRYFLDDVKYVERPLMQPGRIFAPFGDDADVYANVEKVTVSYDSPDVSVQVGDVYAAFGRGVALNVNRNVDIDIDTSIQGAKIVLRPGAWDLTAVFGQLNRQQVFQDNPNINIQGDLRHTVAAVRAERYGVGPANLGVHGVTYGFVSDPGLSAGFRESTGPDVMIGGVTAEVIGLGGIDWFLEADVFDYVGDKLTGGETELGGAVYASASFYPGKTVWLVELKRYVDTNQVNLVLSPELYQVAIAPTLEYERAITEDSAAAVGSENVWGGRARVDWALKPGVFVPYAAVGVFRDLDIGTLHFNDVPETIVHPMVGVEWLPGDGAVLLNVGLRNDDRDGTDFGADRQLHGDVTLNFPLLAGLTGNVNIGAEHYWWGVNPLQQNDYTEMESAWTVSRGSKVGFTWYTDFSSNPLIDSTGNISETVYMAGELQVKPASALTLKAFYGAYKSGIRCSGGQCRLLPGFEGARVSMTGTF